MASNKGAMSMSVSNGFNKTIHFTSIHGLGSVVLSLMSANYMLNGDINLKEKWILLGNNDDAPFMGYFNGNGFTIKNILIDDQTGDY